MNQFKASSLFSVYDVQVSLGKIKIIVQKIVDLF